jgi:hypothetical protein
MNLDNKCERCGRKDELWRVALHLDHAVYVERYLCNSCLHTVAGHMALREIPKETV